MDILERLRRRADNSVNNDLDHKAIAEIARLRAEVRCLHDTRRWNIKVDGSDLLICTGAHKKYEGCEFYRYRAVEQNGGGSKP